ncbi:MAG: phage tail protein [bacterium]|nr:phage tail protein [bacterium]
MSPNQDIVGTVFLFGGTFEPPGYLPCKGAELEITKYGPLYAALGTTYGGNGRTTFALPDYAGHALAGTGRNDSGWTPITLGLKRGKEDTWIRLSPENLPAHTHPGTLATHTLNAAVSSTADLDDSVVTGSLNCSIGSGGHTDPTGRYPGYPTGSGVGVWSVNHDHTQMAPDVLGGGAVSSSDLPLRTTISSGATQVQVGPTGKGWYIKHASLPPVQAINCLICVNGLFPPREGPTPPQPEEAPNDAG